MHTKQTNLSSLSSRLRLLLVIPALAVMLVPLANVLIYYSGTGAATAPKVYAAECALSQNVPAPGSPAAGAGPVCTQPPADTSKSQTVPDLPPPSNACTPSPGTKCCPKGDCIINDYVNPAINTISALVGVAVTISIIYGGIQYASSADNSQKVSEAKTRIVKSIFVLLGYFFFYAFLNYIIPGGLV